MTHIKLTIYDTPTDSTIQDFENGREFGYNIGSTNGCDAAIKQIKWAAANKKVIIIDPSTPNEVTTIIKRIAESKQN